jgi:sugar-phosphatase
VEIPAAGLLFDSDGVLVDSDEAVVRAWTRWAGAYGLAPERVTGMAHGRRSADTVAELVEESRRAEALATIDRYEIAEAAAVAPIPGAPALLRSLPPRIWAVVTSGTPDLARARLAAAGLPPPRVLVTAHDVPMGKPAPDGYLAAAAALGADIADAVVLEDSESGVAAGLAAGVGAVVGVGERALATGARIVVRDLRDLAWTGSALRIPGACRLR